MLLNFVDVMSYKKKAGLFLGGASILNKLPVPKVQITNTLTFPTIWKCLEQSSSKGPNKGSKHPLVIRACQEMKSKKYNLP